MFKERRRQGKKASLLLYQLGFLRCIAWLPERGKGHVLGLRAAPERRHALLDSLPLDSVYEECRV